MKEALLKFIEQHQLIRGNEKMIAAVSGGVDSVVLLHLLLKTKIPCAVAHCNFRLRGEESDGDEGFVQGLAKKYKLPYFVKHFHTEEYASRKGISIQMAARELRYDWFDELLLTEGYDRAATAHNQDDQLETFLINIIRGTGLKGLTGIPVRNGQIIRPLLFASREEILEYAGKNKIHFREDSSNISDKYLRNKVRHRLIPLLETMNPEFRFTLTGDMERFREAWLIHEAAIGHYEKELFTRKKNSLIIPFEKIDALDHPEVILYEVLKKFGFTRSQTDDMIQNLEGQAGKQFYSKDYRLIRDRDALILTSSMKKRESEKYYIDEKTNFIGQPLRMEFRHLKSEGLKIPKDPSIATLDADKLDFPLILRRWQEGDYFIPLGMEDFKKISDFFVDIKLSLHDKEHTWLLTTGRDIVWVVGKRIDQRFRVGPQTKQVLQIRMVE